jgi:hypothetical protein
MPDFEAESVDEIKALAEQLQALHQTLSLPALCARVGAGLTREMLCAIAGFRQRFPDYFDAQLPLL